MNSKFFLPEILVFFFSVQCSYLAEASHSDTGCERWLRLRRNEVSPELVLFVVRYVTFGEMVLPCFKIERGLCNMHLSSYVAP